MDAVALTTLETLRRQHHSLYPVYKLHLAPSDVLASPEGQTWLIEKVLDDPVIRDMRPEEGYERRFWRRIVQCLEQDVEELHKRGDQDAEIDARIYELLTELMVSSNPDRPDNLPSQSHRTFIYDLPGHDMEQTLTLLEEQMAIQGGTTGLRTWTASLHLGHYILTQPEIIFPSIYSRSTSDPAGRSNSQLSSTARTMPPITELGAGTGFLSVLLAQLGADVIATDLGDTSDEYCRQTPLTRLRHNVKLNGMEDRVRVSHLDWMDCLKPETERPEVWQEAKGRTVLAADVIYDPDLVPPLVRSIRALLPSPSGPSSQAIVSATVRKQSTIQLFERECYRAGMEVERLELDPIDPAHPTFWDSGMDEGTEVRIMRITIRGDG